MESTKHIGRVGALAVALGIGAALTSGAGIAWADGADGGSSAGSSDSSGGDGGSRTPRDTDSTSDSSDAEPGRSVPSVAERIRNRAGSRAERTADRQGGAPDTDVESELESELESDLDSELESDLESGVGEDVTDADSDTSEDLGDADTEPTGDRGAQPEAVDNEADSAPAAEGAVDESEPESRSRANRATDSRREPLTQVTAPKGTGFAADSPAQALQDAANGVVEEAAGRGRRASESLRATLEPAVTLASAPVLTATASGDPALATPTNGTAAAEVPQLVTGLLTMAAAPFTGSLPGAPWGGQVPLAWALAAWTRRESQKDVNPDGPDGVALKSVDGTVLPTPADAEVALLAAALVADDEWQQNPGQTPAPVISGSTSSTQTGWTTGNGSGTGPTDVWYVGGTDLGIMWVGSTDSEGKPIVYALFGDTYDVADPASNRGWRDNVLLRSTDLNLNNGLQFSDAVISPGGIYADNTWWNPQRWTVTGNPDGNRAGATQIVPDSEIQRIDRLERTTTYTLIPTAAIAGGPVLDDDGEPQVDEDGNTVNYQYATVMSIKQWGQAGSWTTNWSAVAVSEDGGKTWTIDEDTVRRSSGGNARFQQNAMMYGNPDDPDSWTTPEQTERYVYVYGTPSGRQGSAYVARVPESQITDLAEYQYFAGNNEDDTGNWVKGDPSAATAVISSEGSTGSIFPETGIIGAILAPFVSFLKWIYPAGFAPGGIFSAGGSSGNVSEMSVQYNEYLDNYVVVYTDGGNNVVMRVSDSPQGEWSKSTVLQGNAGAGQNTSMYAPMIHPLSGTDQLGAGNEKYLYYNVSQWNDYNVRMMRADLSRLEVTESL